jgi:hypothetical protein
MDNKNVAAARHAARQSQRVPPKRTYDGTEPPLGRCGELNVLAICESLSDAAILFRLRAGFLLIAPNLTLSARFRGGQGNAKHQSTDRSPSSVLCGTTANAEKKGSPSNLILIKRFGTTCMRFPPLLFLRQYSRLVEIKDL